MIVYRESHTARLGHLGDVNKLLGNKREIIVQKRLLLLSVGLKYLNRENGILRIETAKVEMKGSAEDRVTHFDHKLTAVNKLISSKHMQKAGGKAFQRKVNASFHEKSYGDLEERKRMLLKRENGFGLKY